METMCRVNFKMFLFQLVEPFVSTCILQANIIQIPHELFEVSLH